MSSSRFARLTDRWTPEQANLINELFYRGEEGGGVDVFRFLGDSHQSSNYADRLFELLSVDGSIFEFDRVSMIDRETFKRDMRTWARRFLRTARRNGGIPPQLAGAHEAFRQRQHAAQRKRLQELVDNFVNRFCGRNNASVAAE